jgi:hypothetical protein
VRQVKRGFDKACQTIEAMQALSEKHPMFSFGIASTIFATNLEDARNILAWARTKKLDVVFNMLRFTDNMLGNRDLEESVGFKEREEEFMRQFFLAEHLSDRATFEETICKNCLSPCQVNVGAMKQFVPYAKFLVRAYKVKHNPERHAETLPATQ